ncbi:MAG TPA: hypothetical protein VMS93_05480 [Candidatus Saccharimonadales bacterium]|nr:hypothetical protein [Candidatus Saccharimonadales bacterium]
MSATQAGPLPVALPKDTPRRLTAALLLVLAAGAAMFAFAVTRDPARTWRAYLVSLLFFTGISICGVVWSAVTRLSNGRFAGPVVRIMEGLGAFQPLGFALLAVYLVFGAPHVYPWIHEVYAPAPGWLNLQSVTIRQLVLMFLLVLLNLHFMRLSLRPDLAALQDRVPAKLRGLYRGGAAGFGGTPAEVERLRRTLMRMSPMVILGFVGVWTVLVIDLVMSMDPEWVSTLFPAIGFIGQFLGAICVTAVVTVVVRRKWDLEETITPHTLHSVGLLVFALCTFWASMHWAEYLTIWYGKLPEETHWMQTRLAGHSPWLPWSLACVALVWLLPFVLMMTRAAKANPKSLTFFSVMMLAGLWLERLIFVAPTVSPNAVTFGLVEVLVGAGFLALFTLSYLWFVARFPVLPVVDPYGGGPAAH